MKKLGAVLMVAAIAAISGCKDPDYVRGGKTASSRGEPKQIEATRPPAAPAVEAPAQIETPVVVVEEKPETPVVDVEEKRCECPAGTVHAAPCACGAAGCACKVAEPEPEYTVYIVQPGDYLAKISRKYNIKIDAIKKANPSIKNDVIRIGQKLKLPGKVDVGEQKEPAKAAAAGGAKTSSKFAPYAGETVEYVVKSGDTLGAIAYGHGINIRQLKELNSLSSDVLKIGQKLKVPAGKTAKPAKAEAVAEAAKPAEKTAAAPAKSVESEVADALDALADVQDEPVAPVADAADAAAAAPVAAESYKTYVVQENDDITGISIEFGVSSGVIRELNGLADDEQLKPGTVLKLPPEASAGVTD